MTRENRAKGIVTAIAAVAVFTCGWCLHGLLSVREKVRAETESVRRTVSVETLAARPINPVMRFVGKVVPIQLANITPQIDGYLEKKPRSGGIVVKEGEVLFVIDEEKYRADKQIAEASLAQAEAQVADTAADVDQAERHFKRLMSTDKRGITEIERDTAETTLASKRAALAKSRAAVKRAKAEIAAADFRLKHTVVRAPFEGRIGKAFFDLGEYVSPAKGPLAYLVRTDPCRVDFPVTDRAYLALQKKIAKTGLSPQELVRLRLRLADGSIYPFTGEWKFADNRMSAESATMSIRSVFPNPDHLLITDGYVEVLVDEAKPANVPAVRKSALAHGAVPNGLWVLKDDGTVTLREVTLGRSEGGWVEILSGVALGEKYVGQGVSKLAEGVRVDPVAAMDLGDGEGVPK